MEFPKFKPAFIERYSCLTDFELFKEFSLKFLRRSVRVNTIKKRINEIKISIQKKDWKLEQVPWCREGFWITHDNRKDVGNLLEHNLGYIYTQEAASMIPPIVMEPKAHEKILDIAASPGSKTTQIAQYMDNTGVLIANDYKGIRMAPLSMNIQRMGITNTVVTLNYGQRFKDYSFDRVLVDAPCSGTGTIRKSLKTITIWNPLMVKRLSAQQKQLICTGFENLKEGGTMVYSTCTCEPQENEAVVSHLLEKYENIKIIKPELNGLKISKPITEFERENYDDRVKKCVRIWPQDNDTEGFFVTKIMKTS